MNWHLGEYISNLLHKKGGKRAGWSQSRLSELSGLSTTEISWIITGEASGKKGSPAIRIETLIALAKALGVKEQALIDAYKGKNPDTIDESAENAKQLLMEFLKLIPSTLVVETKNPVEIFETLIASKDRAKIQELCQESMRRKGDG